MQKKEREIKNLKFTCTLAERKIVIVKNKTFYDVLNQRI